MAAEKARLGQPVCDDCKWKGCLRRQQGDGGFGVAGMVLRNNLEEHLRARRLKVSNVLYYQPILFRNKRTKLVAEISSLSNIFQTCKIIVKVPPYLL